MNFVRTRQSLIAWMLYGFILFSGLVCSVSHGQMLGVFNQLTSGLDCGEASDRSEVQGDKAIFTQGADSPSAGDHAQLMALSMTDCAFAGTLALALIVLAGAVWAPGRRRLRIPRFARAARKPPRLALPELIPQAP